MPFLICDKSSESSPNWIAGVASAGRGQSPYSVTFQSGNSRSHSACNRSHASFNSASPLRQRSASASQSRSCSARSFANPLRVLAAILGLAPVAALGHQGERFRVLLLGRGKRAVQLAPQFGQPLRKRLPGAADLAFAPTLALADHRMHALLDGD